MRMKRTGCPPGRRALSVLLSLVLCLSLLPATAAAAGSVQVGDFTLTSDTELIEGSAAGENDYYYDEANSTLYLHTNTPVTVSNTASAATSTQSITVQAPSTETEGYEPKITLDEVHTTGTFTAAAGSDYDLALTVTGTNDLGQVLLWNYNTAGGDKAIVTIDTIDGAGTLNTSSLRAGLPVSSTTLTGITLNGGSINVDGELKITGCTVEADSIYGSTVSISGGSVTSTGAGGYGIYGASGVTISGDAVVDATGGFLNNVAQAGIGVGSDRTITIEDSARVTATGGLPPASSFQSFGAPGIGMIGHPYDPNWTAHIVIQDNASVSATGMQDAAGIGAGQWTTANITISGSPTITARGGENGAGIGLGLNYSSRARATIQISGTPRINAQAGPDGDSGIGLGSGQANVAVTITGGSFAQGDISTQTVGGQKVADGYYVDSGDDSDFPYEVKQAPSGTVLVVPTAVTLQMGKTQQFTLVGADSDANVTWSVDSTNSSIENGLLTLGMNETKSTLTVRATVDGAQYTAQVTVQEPVYTVTFAPGEGGSGTADPAKVSRNDTGTFPYTLPGVGAGDGLIDFTALAGMHFAGWRVSGNATTEDGTPAAGQILSEGTVITLTGDVTLTANWAETPAVTLYGVELENEDSGTGYSYAYDQETGVSTLTLNDYQGNFSVSGEDVGPDGYYAALYCNHDLVLVLNGTNSLTLTGPDSGVTDIYGNGIAVLGSLTIRDGSSEETGSLSVNVERFDSCTVIAYEGSLTVESGDVTARRNQMSNESTTYVLRGDGDEHVGLQVTGGSLTLIDASLEVTDVSSRNLSNDFRGKITVAHGPADAGAYETDYNTAWDLQLVFPYVKMEAIADHTQPTVYPIWVAGKQVTSVNAADVLGDGTASVSYAADTATLTLNGARITAPGGEGIRAEVDGAALYADQDLTLSVTGDNTLTGAAVSVGGSTRSYGIYMYGRDLTVTGSGTLTAKGADAYYSYGIDTSSENLLAVDGDGGVVVTGIAGQGPEEARVRGISASPTGGSVLVSESRDGTGLRALSGDENLYDFPYGVVYNPVATEVVIRKNEQKITKDTLQIPASDSLSVPYTAALLDQVGMEVTGHDVNWSTSGTVPSGVTVTNSTVGVGSNASDGTFTLTAECGGKEASVVITVSNKVDAGVTITGAPTTTITYGDDDFTLSANAAQTGDSGIWTWTSSNENVLQVTPGENGSATVAVTGAGAADITASYSSDTTVGSATVQLTVNRRTVTITGLTAADKEYDGKTNAIAAGNATLTGVVGDDDVTISSGSASFADKDVGTGKTVTFTGYGLTGADADNYTLSAQPASVTASITPKTIGVTDLAATDRPYNGTTRVELTGGTLDGVIKGDTVELDLTNAYGDMTDANVGNGKDVAVSGLALSGADARNYTLGPVTGVTVNITKANAPSLNDVTVQQRYSETSGQASVAGVGMPDGAGTLTYTKGNESTTGTVTVTDWSVDENGKVTYTLSGGAAGDTVTLPVVISSVNYQDATVNVAITLTEKYNQAALTLSNAEMTYGGTLTLSAAGGSGIGEVTYAIVSGDAATLNGSVLTATGVGTVTVRATKAGDRDYNEATAAATITIKKAVPAMTLSASPSSLTGGTVTLTVTDAPGSVSVSCTSDASVTVEAAAQPNSWTVTLPSGAKSYTFSAAYAGNDYYESAAATCTVTVHSSGGGSTGGGSIGGGSGGTSGVDGSGDNVSISPSGGSVTSSQMGSAVKKADEGSTITIKATSSTTVTLPVGGMAEAADNHNDIVVDLRSGEVVLSARAVASMTDGASASGRVEVVITSQTNSKDETISDLMDKGAAVFDVSVEVDGKSIHSFDGDLTISFTVSNLSKISDPHILHILTDGSKEYYAPDSISGNTITVKGIRNLSTFAVIPGSEMPKEPANPFTDVYESDYYYDAVLWAVENGVTNGTSSVTFSPDANVSRAQMVTFLWRTHGSPKATGTNPFTDVSTSDYYYDAVLWAVTNGVTNGTSATTFSPDMDVTRAQAVTFQWRAAGSTVMSGTSFDDVAADAYYANAVTWAVANGITSGTGGNNFGPVQIVSRAQAVTFLYRQHG